MGPELIAAIRRLRANALHSALIIAVLALAIGANSAVFSAIHALLLKPLPYPDSTQLVRIYNSYPKLGVADSMTTVVDYQDRQGGADGLDDSAAYFRYSYDLTDQSIPLRVPGVGTTPSLFSILQVQAQLGRTFVDAEATAGQERVVLLSDALWRNHFGADPKILGRTIQLSAQPYEVIGVMPANFAFPDRDIGLWLPWVFSEKQQSDEMRGFEFAESVGRLKPSTSIAQVEAQFQAIIAANIVRLSASEATAGSASKMLDGGLVGRARPLQDYLTSKRAPTLWLLQAATAMILLLACANIANLMLIGAHQRQRELSIRAALGASRWRSVRQLLIEGALLSGAGLLLGLLIAHAGLRLLQSMDLDGAQWGVSMQLDGTVLAFAVLCTGLTTLVVGLLPGIAAGNLQAGQSLRAGGRGSAGSRSASSLRDALSVLQIVLVVALLSGGGLLLRSFVLLQQQDPGFNRSQLLTVSGQLSRDRYVEPAQTRAFLDSLLTTVRDIPGIESVGLAGGLPFSSDFGSSPYFIEGEEANAQPRHGNMQSIDEDYFRTMQIPLLQGRGFLPTDDEQALPVSIIDMALARRAFGERNPIGQRLGTPGLGGTRNWTTIVGVVGSIKRESLAQDSDIDTYYGPYRQGPIRIFRLLIRSQRPLAELTPLLQAAVASIDPQQPLYDLTSMDQRIERSLDTQRTPMRLVLLFATVALILAALGVYAIFAFGVAQRTAEIGVRMALGAKRSDILQMVYKRGAGVLLIGLLLGSGTALLLAQAIRAQLFGVQPSDPLTLISVLILVTLVVLAAIWRPASRASRVEPVIALRSE